jgi:hypothetical protein
MFELDVVGRPVREASARPRFFLLLAMLFAALVLAGFSRTFFIPLAAGTFSRPAVVVVHGLLFFAWVAILVTQVSFVAAGRLRWHQRLGIAGAALILPMVAACVVTSGHSALRDLAGGPGALSIFAGACLGMALFLGLATAGLALRRRSPEGHKRLMLLATLTLLGAAVGRIPVVDAYTSWILTGLLALLGGYDLLITRRLHPAAALGGLAVLADIWGTTLLTHTGPCQQLTRHVLVLVGALPPA